MTVKIPSDKVIHRITQFIIHYYDPDKIILFGSFAKEKVHENSDIDILVIKDTSVPKRYRGMDFLGVLAEYPISIDLLILTPSEYEEEKKQPYSFFHCIDKASRVLYEKKG